MKETDVKYMPKVGDRVQAQTRGINYNNGELGEVVFVDRTKVSISDGPRSPRRCQSSRA